MNSIKAGRTLVAMFFLVALNAQAQDDVLANADMQAARASIEATQEAFIRNDLGLTAEEAAAFWPLFERYRSDTLPLRDRYVVLFADFLRRYDAGTLTAEHAEAMLREFFEVRIGLLQIRETYIDDFAEILPMLKVVRLYQLENKLTADVEAELSLIVPLVEVD
jgi:hypothetical protein